MSKKKKVQDTNQTTKETKVSNTKPRSVSTHTAYFGRNANRTPTADNYCNGSVSKRLADAGEYGAYGD